MRIFFAIFAFSVVVLVSILGFRGSLSERPPIEIFPDMERQSKYKAQSESRFFADGRTDRPVPPGVVHRQYDDPASSERLDDDHYNRGRDSNGDYAEGFPMVVSRAVMERGQDRYRIFCGSCHGGVGDGQGITGEYGMVGVPDFNTERLQDMPEGEWFEVISQGRGLMGAYKDKLNVDDRWAVIAYVRALQRARLGTEEDVPEDMRGELGL